MASVIISDLVTISTFFVTPGKRHLAIPLAKRSYSAEFTHRISLNRTEALSASKDFPIFTCKSSMKKIPYDFYNRKDVLTIARELLGKIVVSHIGGVVTSGRVVETEAYVGMTDRASHAFGGRRTPKNEHMYHDAGTAYIYLCYGIHQMLNIVTNETNIPDAILIRALEPLTGLEEMARRTGKKGADTSITRGPGNVGKALGIDKTYSGCSLTGNDLYLADDGFVTDEMTMGISSRIGVQSAGDDALLPYRFFLKGNRYVSANNQKSI